MNQIAIEALVQWGYVWPDKTTLSAACGHAAGAQALHRSWKSALTGVFDAQALHAGYVIKGRQLTLVHLQTLQNHCDAWAARVHEAQGLAPLLAARVEFGREPLPDLGGLRAQLLQKGMRPVTWKWLRKQPTRLAQRLFGLGVTAESLWWANLLAQAQVPGRLARTWVEPGRVSACAELYRWAQDNPNQADWLQVGLQRLLKTLPLATEQARLEWELLLGHLIPQLNFRETSRPWVAHNATWSSLRRQAHEEVQMRLRQAATQKNAQAPEGVQQAWEARLTAFEAPESLKLVSVKELTSAAALKQEGTLMSHCVGNGTYVEDCLKGEQVIVRLQEPFIGQLATLQLRKSAGCWQVAQLAGPHNRAVPQLFWSVSRHLVEHLQTHF